MKSHNKIIIKIIIKRIMAVRCTRKTCEGRCL